MNEKISFENMNAHNKAELRRELRFWHQHLSNEEVLHKSKLISKRILALPEYASAKTILCYAPFDKEVDLHAIAQNALHESKRVAFPKVNPETGAMVVTQVTNGISDLIKGSYGIKEPVSTCPLIEPVIIDLALIPGIGFDLLGDRVGFGKGYYDCFLKKTPALRIGVAYDFQVVP